MDHTEERLALYAAAGATFVFRNPRLGSFPRSLCVLFFLLLLFILILSLLLLLLLVLLLYLL